jgi:hypothetical protein
MRWNGRIHSEIDRNCKLLWWTNRFHTEKEMKVKRTAAKAMEKLLALNSTLI